jgi:predicted CXXCH cytochrome family protein
MNILFPISNDVKAVSNIHIVGMTDTDIPVTVTINGVKTEKRLICDGTTDAGKNIYMLMTILKLDPGENKIVITQGEQNESYTITKVDSPVSITDWTKNLSGFHASGKKEICMNCHKFQNLSDCVNCHKDKFIGKWVHKPVKEARCFECHEKERNFIPAEPFAETCLKCHEKMNNSIAEAPYTHGPVAAGFCTICHSPHKSTDKTHLRKPANSLCADCHVADDQGFSYHSQSYIKFHPVDKVFVKKLDKELECSDCHNPHYSNSPMMLDAEDESSLCSKCHDASDTEALLKKLADEYNKE